MVKYANKNNAKSHFQQKKYFDEIQKKIIISKIFFNIISIETTVSNFRWRNSNMQTNIRTNFNILMKKLIICPESDKYQSRDP